MTKKISGLSRANDNGRSEMAPVRAVGGLYFHPRCSARLEEGIRQRSRALTQARIDAIRSVKEAIMALRGQADLIDRAQARALVDMLERALAALEARDDGKFLPIRGEIALLLEARACLTDVVASMRR